MRLHALSYSATAHAAPRDAGVGHGAVTCRVPVSVRPAVPRFLQYGDSFQVRVLSATTGRARTTWCTQLPVSVRNATSESIRVRLALRCRNLALLNGAGRLLTVPPNTTCERGGAACVSCACDALCAGQLRRSW